ncbi:hypothetical protein AHIS1_p003 [Acaryochloris phage A-HIS1]|nr:hypothetical protein AHIS1_p003 [Acaryochloris phage A-HIS1]
MNYEDYTEALLPVIITVLCEKHNINLDELPSIIVSASNRLHDYLEREFPNEHLFNPTSEILKKIHTDLIEVSETI